MYRYVTIFLFQILYSCIAVSQKHILPSTSDKKTVKGHIYGSVGWHRIYYTRSTIHFQNQKEANFDFKLIKASAKDDNDLNIGKGFAAPQWSLRLGYVLNQKKSWGLEFNYDHAKYILRQGQHVRINGHINGQQIDKDTLIHPDFIEYEHTNGANYYMLNLIKKNLLYTDKKGRQLALLYKAGAGIVMPRTNSRILGFHFDDRYHVSGWLTGIESTLRYELIKNFFTEISVKAAYANYSDVLLYGSGRASQYWFSFQYLFTAAYQLPVFSKNN